MANFKDEYQARTKELLELSVGEKTPYKATLDFLSEKFNEYKITEEQRVKILSNMLPNITVAFTTSAMQLGMDLAHKQLTFEIEIEGLQKQNQALDENIRGIQEQTRNTRLKNDEFEAQKELRREGLEKQNQLLGAQIAKLQKETALAESQQQAIDKQVSDNRVIKVGAMMQDFVTNNHAHSINVPTDMIKYYFNILHGLIKKDLPELQAPTNFTMNKR